MEHGDGDNQSQSQNLNQSPLPMHGVVVAIVLGVGMVMIPDQKALQMFSDKEYKLKDNIELMELRGQNRKFVR